MTGRTIILTGASRGIGLATARFLLQEGVQVVAVQRSSPPEFEALQKEYPKTLHVIQGSSTDDAVIKQAVQDAKKLGSVDGVVLNAGVGNVGATIADGDLAEWQRVFDLNVFGVVKFLREALPVLSDGAKVVVVSSLASEIGLPGGGPYSASKAALNSVNRTVAAENPKIVAVAIEPGTVITKGAVEFMEGLKKYLPESMSMESMQILEVEVPSRVIANLALRARPELSGKYLHWNDPALSTL